MMAPVLLDSPKRCVDSDAPVGLSPERLAEGCEATVTHIHAHDPDIRPFW